MEQGDLFWNGTGNLCMYVGTNASSSTNRDRNELYVIVSRRNKLSVSSIYSGPANEKELGVNLMKILDKISRE